MLIICRSLFVTLQCVLGLTISGQGDKGTGSEGILTFSLNLYCQTSLLAYNHYQLEYKQWDNILFSWNNEIKKLLQYFIFGPILSSLKSSYIKVNPQYCSLMIPKTCLQLSPCQKVKNWVGKLTLSEPAYWILGVSGPTAIFLAFRGFLLSSGFCKHLCICAKDYAKLRFFKHGLEYLSIIRYLEISENLKNRNGVDRSLDIG